MLALPALLLADGGAETSGKYLVRSKGSSTDEFILSVIYKGQPTHHTCTREADGAEFAVNKTPTGCNDLAAVSSHLLARSVRSPSISLA